MLDERPFRVAGRRTVANAAFLRLDRIHLDGADHGALVRVAVTHPGAVAVVPVAGTDVILIEQYRAPIGGRLLEIPAGKLDVPGEPPEATAMRELEEEIGFHAERMEPIGVIHTSPGFSDEAIALFAAFDLTEVGSLPSGAEEETARIVRMPLTTALQDVAAGRITDAKTIAGLFLVARER